MAELEPLRGCRVLDLTTFLSGPLVGRALADLGAEVIKIEPPTGDPTRGRAGEPLSPLWRNIHRGRRSMVLDLKTTAGREALLGLVPHADVLLENYRPGVMQRFGLGAEQVRAVNPRLVFCTITGFGPDGPVSDQVSIDGPVQAFAGAFELAELNGFDPMPMVVTIADIAGAGAASQAVLAALLARERSGTGCHVDVSLFEAVLPWVVVNRRAALAPPVTVVARGSDGLAFLVQTPVHFHSRLLELVGRVPGFERFAADPRFADREGAKAHAAEYTDNLHRAFATATRDHWLGLLKAEGIPAAPVHTIDEALDHPQLHHRRAVADSTGPAGDVGRVVLPPYRFDGERRSVVEVPPVLGADTFDILRTVAGYDDDAITAMAEGGAFGSAVPAPGARPTTGRSEAMT